MTAPSSARPARRAASAAPSPSPDASAAPAALEDLRVFVAVAEAGGFTAAADRLGLAKGRVSTVVRRLESAVGAQLLHRTTRRVALSEAGRHLHAQAAPLLAGLDEALAGVSQAGAPLAGPLRVSAPVDHAAAFVAPLLAGFVRRHPGVQAELRASDHLADLVAEGVDVAIRQGWLRDSSLRATRLGSFEQWVVAAPVYLREAPPLRRPADLVEHDWLALTLLPSPLTWRFASRRGGEETVRVRARLRTDSPSALRALALAGAGVTVMVGQSVEDDVRQGRLVRVLAGWSLPEGGVHAVFPPGRHVPARVQAFVEAYRAAWAAAQDARAPALRPTPSAARSRRG